MIRLLSAKITTIIDSLPYELFKIFILCIICARLVLPLVHGTVHARLEEGPGRAVCFCCYILVELVDISMQVAPQEDGFSVSFTSAEF